MINKTIMRSLIVRQTQYNYIHVLLLTIPHWIYSKKTSAGNHGFYHLIWGFSVNLPIITFCENRFFFRVYLVYPITYLWLPIYRWFSLIFLNTCHTQFTQTPGKKSMHCKPDTLWLFISSLWTTAHLEMIYDDVPFLTNADVPVGDVKEPEGIS